MHQNPAATILVSPQVVENAQDKTQLERKLRETYGRPDLRIMNVRKLTDGSGKINGYEVDIR